MATVSLSLDEIYKLANKTLLANGCDQETADILSELITNAERDGSLSHMAYFVYLHMFQV